MKCYNPSHKETPISNISKIELLIWKLTSQLLGVRMYSANGKVIFTTGGNIESKKKRNDKENMLQIIDLRP